MIEYKIIKVYWSPEETEERLNLLAKENWRVICSYNYDSTYLVLERNQF